MSKWKAHHGERGVLRCFSVETKRQQVAVTREYSVHDEGPAQNLFQNTKFVTRILRAVLGMKVHEKMLFLPTWAHHQKYPLPPPPIAPYPP
jgi:hypothetical protein